MGRRERRAVERPYQVYVHPAAWKEMKSLPGHMRHRVKKAVDSFVADPRPPKSDDLESGGSEQEARRLRMENWRVIYVVTEEDKMVDVLGIRKRPPYDYEDLEALIGDLL